jgi:hypothetical protein
MEYKSADYADYTDFFSPSASSVKSADENSIWNVVAAGVSRLKHPPSGRNHDRADLRCYGGNGQGASLRAHHSATATGNCPNRPAQAGLSGKFLPAPGNYCHHPSKIAGSSAHAGLGKGISEGSLEAGAVAEANSAGAFWAGAVPPAVSVGAFAAGAGAPAVSEVAFAGWRRFSAEVFAGSSGSGTIRIMGGRGGKWLA